MSYLDLCTYLSIRNIKIHLIVYSNTQQHIKIFYFGAENIHIKKMINNTFKWVLMYNQVFM